MHTGILRRAGVVLLALGAIDLAVTIVRLTEAGPYPASIDAAAAIAGLALLFGGPRAALWVRSIAVFLLAAGIALVVAVPFYQPLNLTITQIRLEPWTFIPKAAELAFTLCVLFWAARELGRRPVLDAIITAGIKRWDMSIPAQAGAGVVALGCLLLWLALQGQTKQLAESLALEQLGPGYRYHLSWISKTSIGHGTSVAGMVTAWNDREIKTVVLHWETP